MGKKGDRSLCEIRVEAQRPGYGSDAAQDAAWREKRFPFTPRGYSAAIKYAESFARRGMQRIMIDVSCNTAAGLPNGQIMLARCGPGQGGRGQCVASPSGNRSDIGPLAGVGRRKKRKR